MRWVIAVSIAIVMAVAGWRGYARSQEAAVIRAASTLATPTSWALVSESFRPARVLCMSGRCPELTRTFTANAANPHQIAEVLDSSGWSLTFDAPCSPTMTTVQTGCSATGLAHGIPASLYVFGITDEPGAARVIVHVG